MKCSFGISDFLEEICSLSHSVVFLYFFALIAEEGFLISSCYSLELCIQMFISFLFSFAFRFSSFHTFFNLSLNFFNKEFMIWATVSSRSCSCWLYSTSPSLTTKNIINLILVLTIWWCPRVGCLLCCWKRVFGMASMFSWQDSVSLCPASFCTSRPNLLVIPGYLLISYFCIPVPYNEKDIFFGC